MSDVTALNNAAGSDDVKGVHQQFLPLVFNLEMKGFLLFFLQFK